MGSDYSRPLTENKLAHGFLVDVLGRPNNEETGYISMHVRSTELLQTEMKQKSTLKSLDNRHPMYINNDTRRLLRTNIFEDLIYKDRSDSDEEIKLNFGGSKPKTIFNKKEAIIITGLPASGKSTVATKIADHYGAYILDSDYAKRKFPEFAFDFGASLVHEESDLVVFGSTNPDYKDELNLLEYCIGKGYNVVIPKIGYNYDSVIKLRDSLIAKKYKVHLLLISLDRLKATERALVRFHKTKRYVSLSLIFDCYANDPILTYHRTKNDRKWKSYGKLSTDVNVGMSPLFIEGCKHSPAHLFNV